MQQYLEKEVSSKELANRLLEAPTLESYQTSLKYIKGFVQKEKSVEDWIKCWDDRKQLIFRAFTGSDKPRMNQEEVFTSNIKIFQNYLHEVHEKGLRRL